MSLNRNISLAGRWIGPDYPSEFVFLPDIGTFFNKDISLALTLVEALQEAECTFIKSEILHDAEICIPSEMLETITDRGGRVYKENYRALIERKVLPLESYARICAHVRDRGMYLALSVYDLAGLAFAQSQGAALVKIASSNIVHKPLIQSAAKCGIPVALDTGKATMIEIERAFNWFVDSGGVDLVIQHSPEPPPAPVSDHNLGMVAQFATRFHCPVGLSDHHQGDEMMYAALALGASVIEKGVSPNSLELEQDLAHSLRVGQVAEVLRKCTNIAKASGVAQRYPFGKYHGHLARMGLFAARDIPAGALILSSDVRYAFPAIGIPVEEIDGVLGRTTSRPIGCGAPIESASLLPVANDAAPKPEVLRNKPVFQKNFE